MVTGIIKGFKYEKSEYNLTQGHGAYERSGYRGGRYINQRGFGWASESKPSRITLKIDVDGIMMCGLTGILKIIGDGLRLAELPQFKKQLLSRLNFMKIFPTMELAIIQFQTEAWLCGLRMH